MSEHEISVTAKYLISECDSAWARQTLQEAMSRELGPYTTITGARTVRRAVGQKNGLFEVKARHFVFRHAATRADARKAVENEIARGGLLPRKFEHDVTTVRGTCSCK